MLFILINFINNSNNQMVMETLFIIKLLLSFIVGGIWVAASTRIAEKAGTKIGGFVSGLPSTMVVAFFFIGLAEGASVAAAGASIVPIIEIIDLIYVIIVVLLMKRSLLFAFLSALIFWAVSSFIVLWLNLTGFLLGLLLIGIFTAFLLLYLEKILDIKSISKITVPSKRRTLLFRAIFGGFMIAFAVLMAKISGPLVGGLFAMFPAMMTATIVVTYFLHGHDFSKATMKTCLLSLIGIVSYGAVVHYAFVPLGIWLGTLAAIVVSYSISFVFYSLYFHRVN